MCLCVLRARSRPLCVCVWMRPRSAFKSEVPIPGVISSVFVFGLFQMLTWTELIIEASQNVGNRKHVIFRVLVIAQVPKSPIHVVSLSIGQMTERRRSVVVSTSAWYAAGRWFDSRTRHVSLSGFYLALNNRDCLSVPFGGDTKSRRSLLSGVYARGSKRSHTGGKQTDPLSWTTHLSQPLL